MHDLAARLARGDEAAFAALYDACADRLYHYVATRLGSRDSAGDVVQSAFLRAVKSRRRFRGVENPVAYMFQIARNEALRAARLQRRRQSTAVDSAWPPTLWKCDNAYYLKENAELVAAALGRLSADDRELIELKVYGGLTFQEVADVLRLPPGTVATRYRRALESLRPWLTKQMK